MTRGQPAGAEVTRRLGRIIRSALLFWRVSPQELSSDLAIDAQEIEAIISGTATTKDLVWFADLYDYVAVHLDAPVIGDEGLDRAFVRIEAWLARFPQLAKESDHRDDLSSR